MHRIVMNDSDGLLLLHFYKERQPISSSYTHHIIFTAILFLINFAYCNLVMENYDVIRSLLVIISHMTCDKLSLFFSTRHMELSSDEETWCSLRIDNGSSKKQLSEKRPGEPLTRPTKKANTEPSHSNNIEPSHRESSNDGKEQKVPEALKQSKETKAVALNALPATGKVGNSDHVSNLPADITERADKSIASTLPSNGLQGISSKLKNNLDSSNSSAATPVGSPKTVKVKEIKHSERVVQASIARYKPCKCDCFHFLFFSAIAIIALTFEFRF